MHTDPCTKRREVMGADYIYIYVNYMCIRFNTTIGRRRTDTLILL